jgi:acetolactate synthase-1/2/3 large subunit
MVIFNNGSYGWIRATNRFSFGGKHFATDFGSVDYVGVAESHGIPGFRADSASKLQDVLQQFFATEGPALLDLIVPPEDECIPPVPEWGKEAKKLGIYCSYWG